MQKASDQNPSHEASTKDAKGSQTEQNNSIHASNNFSTSTNNPDLLIASTPVVNAVDAAQDNSSPKDYDSKEAKAVGPVKLRRSENARWDNMSRDILAFIFNFLEPHELMQTAVVCTAWRYPYDKKILLKRALYYEEKLRIAEALRDVDLALRYEQSETKNIRSLNLKADLLYTYGRYSHSLELYENILKTDAHNIMALLGRGKTHLVMGKLQEASRDFNAVLELDAKNINALIGLAEVHRNNRELAPAKKHLAKCLELDAKNAQALYEKALIEIQSKEYGAASNSNAAVLKTDKNNMIAAYLHGFVDMLEANTDSDLTRASNRFSRLSRTVPSNAAVLLGNATAHRLKKSINEGRQLAKKAIDLDPFNAPAHYCYAKALVDIANVSFSSDVIESCRRMIDIWSSPEDVKQFATQLKWAQETMAKYRKLKSQESSMTRSSSSIVFAKKSLSPINNKMGNKTVSLPNNSSSSSMFTGSSTTSTFSGSCTSTYTNSCANFSNNAVDNTSRASSQSLTVSELIAYLKKFPRDALDQPLGKENQYLSHLHARMTQAIQNVTSDEKFSFDEKLDYSTPAARNKVRILFIVSFIFNYPAFKNHHVPIGKAKQLLNEGLEDLAKGIPADKFLDFDNGHYPEGLIRYLLNYFAICPQGETSESAHQRFMEVSPMYEVIPKLKNIIGQQAHSGLFKFTQTLTTTMTYTPYVPKYTRE